MDEGTHERDERVEAVDTAVTRQAWSRKKLTRRYNAKRDVYDRLLKEAAFILTDACEEYGDRVYSILKRVKTLESVARKAETHQLSEPLDSMCDVVGLRVVCLYRSDLPAIRKTIQESFRVAEVDDKAGQQADPSVFDYESIHFKALLPAACGGPRYEGLTDEPFEIQLRTLAMDTWATISHDLSYKKGWTIPRELQRDFHAVAALMHLADKHFDDVYKHVNRQRRSAEAALSAAKPALQRKATLYNVSAYLKWKFPQRDHVPDGTVGELAESLLLEGVRTLGALDRLVEAGLPHVLHSERIHNAADDSDGPYYYADVGAARIAVRHAKPDFELAKRHAVFDAGWRTVALEAMPIEPEKVEELLAELRADPPITVENCDMDLTRTRAFLSSIPSVDVDATLAWLSNCGADCDCAIPGEIALLLDVGPTETTPRLDEEGSALDARPQ